MSEPRGMTVKEAAAYCGIRPTGLRALVRIGEAPKSIPMGKRARVWLREDLDAWLDRLSEKVVASGIVNEWMV
jgi:predicted DNA-binding transcriptional regulator AlpA